MWILGMCKIYKLPVSCPWRNVIGFAGGRGLSMNGTDWMVPVAAIIAGFLSWALAILLAESNRFNVSTVPCLCNAAVFACCLQYYNIYKITQIPANQINHWHYKVLIQI